MSYPPKKSFEEVELPTNPNLPAWVISPKEEKLIFERWRKRAFARCDDLIKAYIECSNSYLSPLDAMKNCDAANKKSLDCVAKYQKIEYLDVERDLLIKEKLERRRLLKEKIEKEQKK